MIKPVRRDHGQVGRCEDKGWRVLRTRAEQVSLWESVLPAEVLRLPGELAQVDALLDDPVFFVTVDTQGAGCPLAAHRATVRTLSPVAVPSGPPVAVTASAVPAGSSPGPSSSVGCRWASSPARPCRCAGVATDAAPAGAGLDLVGADGQDPADGAELGSPAASASAQAPSSRSAPCRSARLRMPWADRSRCSAWTTSKPSTSSATCGPSWRARDRHHTGLRAKNAIFSGG